WCLVRDGQQHQRKIEPFREPGGEFDGSISAARAVRGGKDAGHRPLFSSSRLGGPRGRAPPAPRQFGLRYCTWSLLRPFQAAELARNGPFEDKLAVGQTAQGFPPSAFRRTPAAAKQAG